MLVDVFTRSVMDKNTNSGAGVKSVEKKLDSEVHLLGANQSCVGHRRQQLRLGMSFRWRHPDRDASFT